MLLLAHKLTIGVLLFFAGLFYFTVPAFAQTTITPDNYKAPQNANYAILNLEHTVFCEGAGVSVVKGQKCLGYNQNGQLALYGHTPSGGMLGGINNAIAALYIHPPTSTTEYLADVGSNLGLISPAYAQNFGGAGEGVVKPMLQLWQAFRNVAYLAFILVFLAVGFMIMFRQRLNPQTVVSIQSALPGLVIGLILVTFSYFISALIVDLSFIGIQLVAGLFQSTNLQGIDQLARQDNIFSLFGAFKNSVGQSDPALMFARLFTPSDEIRRIYEMSSGPLGPVLGPFLAEKLAQFAGAVTGTLILVIILIALLIQMFRLLWQLINSYITILVITTLSPLIILMSSLPGRGGTLGMWWRSILGNALVFPAVFATFLFAGVVLNSTGQFNQTLPLLQNLPVQLLSYMIAIGIVLGSPAVPALVKKAVGAPDIQGIPQAAMAGFAAGTGGLGFAVGQGYNRAMTMSGLAAEQEALQREEVERRRGAVAGWGDLRRNALRILPRPRT